MRPLTCVDPTKKTHTINHPLIRFPGYPHGLTPPGTNSEQHGIVPFFKCLKGNPFTQRRIQMYLKPGTLVLQSRDILVDNTRRQSEFRDAPDHRSTGAVSHLIDINLKSGNTQVVCSRQPRWSRTHYSYALTSRGGDRFRPVGRTKFIHHVALEIANLYCTVAAHSAASRLTGRVADPSTN